MSNASLKEQLEAVASQLSDKLGKKEKTPRQKFPPFDKPQKPKPKWLDYVQYGVELLKVYFPTSFKTPNEIRPLKIGIKQDLVKRLSSMDSIVIEDKACMVKSLAYYVNTSAYHKNVVESAVRIDLDGNPAGLVTAEEAKYSLERQQAKLQAKASVASTMQQQAHGKEKATQ
jgi:ProP effector